MTVKLFPRICHNEMLKVLPIKWSFFPRSINSNKKKFYNKKLFSGKKIHLEKSSLFLPKIIYSIFIDFIKCFRLENNQDMRNPEKSFMSCHSVDATEPEIPVYVNSEYQETKSAKYKINTALTERIVTYVKSDCDSGYVCMELSWTGLGVTTLTLGAKSTNPEEACTHLYYSKSLQRKLLLVSPHASPQPCPLSGRYSLQPLASTVQPQINSLSPGGSECRKPSWLHISAGCRSTSLNIESDCESPQPQNEHNKTNANSLSARYSCKAAWSASTGQNYLVVQAERTGQTFCLTYGDKTLSVSGNECGDPRGTVFSMSETAPCLQALSSHPTSVTGAANSFYRSSCLNIVVILMIALKSSGLIFNYSLR